MPLAHHIKTIRAAFLERPKWTSAQLAVLMECSERTVRRCVDHLRDEGKWPIDSGKAGYTLREPSMGETRITSHQEIAAMAMAVEALRQLGGTRLAAQINSELAKLCRRTDAFQDIRWEELSGLVVPRESHAESPPDMAIHGKLTLAILQQNVAAIHYRRLEEVQGYARKVFPQRLICRDGCWYLIAWDLEADGQRTYALPRISTVEIHPLPDGFVPPPFDNRQQHAFGIWTPYEEDAVLQEVVVEIHGYWARLARERRWHPSQRLEDLAPDLVRVRFRLNELVEVKTWVLGLGEAATVIAPPELIEMVTGEIHQMRANYQSPDSNQTS
jgi:predicted DNA-binding transcriptional regulator YafY